MLSPVTIWWRPVVLALALGTASPLLALPQGGGLLHAGGLLPLCVAAVVALCAAPIAQQEWYRPQAPPGGWGHLSEAARELTPVLLLSAMMGPLGASLGPAGVTAAVLSWGLIWLPPVVAGVLAGLGALALCALGVMGTLQPGLTLAQPTLGEVSSWLPYAVLIGLLWAGVGLGQWARVPPRPPGMGRTPWLAVGAGICAATLGAIHLSGQFEVGLGHEDRALLTGVSLTLLSAATATLRAGAVRPAQALGGAAATMWFATVGSTSAPTWWQGVLPWLLAIPLLLRALTSRGLSRYPTAAAALLCMALPMLTWRGPPQTPAAALTSATLTVGVFWYLATAASLHLARAQA